jgi:hypothetical protein
VAEVVFPPPREVEAELWFDALAVLVEKLAELLPGLSLQ